MSAPPAVGIDANPAPPPALPMPELGLSLSPSAQAGSGIAWIAGAIAPAAVLLGDLNAHAFYLAAGGITTRNRGGRRHTRGAHGLEDGARRRRD